MTQMIVAPAGVGRACPYCRFALKEGMLVEQCDACHALHHEDCWDDGRGCAVVGCGAAASAPTVVADAHAPQLPPPPAPLPPPAPAPDRGTRSLLVGLVGGLLIAAAGAGGYVLAAGDRDGDGEPAPSPAAAPAAPRAETPPVATPEAPEPTAREIEEQVLPEIERIIEFSREGRTAVRAGRYEAAIRNRERVLARLDPLEAAPGRLGRAQRKLRQAMEASLEADRNYAAGVDASAADALATRRKREFVDLWNPVARNHGATVYHDGEF